LRHSSGLKAVNASVMAAQSSSSVRAAAFRRIAFTFENATGASTFDGFVNALDFVGQEIVHDGNIAGGAVRD